MHRISLFDYVVIVYSKINFTNRSGTMSNANHMARLFFVMWSSRPFSQAAVQTMLLSTHSHDLVGGASPLFPLVVHQPASPSIWSAVQSLRWGCPQIQG